MAVPEILLFAVFPLACYGLALRHDYPAGGGPATLRGRIRARGWGLLLPILGLMLAALSTWNRFLIVAEVVSTCLIMVYAPRLASKMVPFLLLVLGVIGVVLAKNYRASNEDQILYGVVLAGAESWRTRFVLPETACFFAVGGWLFFRVQAPGAGLIRRAADRWWRVRVTGVRRGQEFLLLLVLLLFVSLLGLHNWFAIPGWTGTGVVLIDLLAAAGAVLLILRSRLWAATLAAAGLLVLGAYGILLAFYSPSLPGQWYGVAQLNGVPASLEDCAIEGVVLLALGFWSIRGVMGERLGTHVAALEQRVQTLTRTRTDAVDTAAAELRRIERDLHDGAQARLVALGMSLQAAERLFSTSPDAALALVSEAKEASSRALTELRDLVRGIYPPVLADRGLADALRSLALDCPLHVITDIDLPGEVEMPVGSAVYFSVAEALTNAAKHTDASTVRIEVSHGSGTLRAQVTDDGAGGADPAQGTGLTGIERRLATFDGILAVSSPLGGPTIVAIEVPCALSSVKTSSC